MRPLWPIAFCLLAGPALSSTGDEQSFQNRFAGNWTGGGPVRRNAESPIIDASCAVTGDHAPNRMSISGSCRGAVVFTRDISADVTFNPATGRYSGTYVGARAGPAAIVGKRNGNRINFTMTWPKPVNGSTRARMSILNDGQGMLRIQVVSQPQPDGPATTLSDLTFRRN